MSSTIAVPDEMKSLVEPFRRVLDAAKSDADGELITATMSQLREAVRRMDRRARTSA